MYSKYFVFVVYVDEDVNKSFLIEFLKLEIGLAAQLFTVGGLWNVSGLASDLVEMLRMTYLYRMLGWYFVVEVLPDVTM